MAAKRKRKRTKKKTKTKKIHPKQVSDLPKVSYPIVYVEWADPATKDAWHDTDEAKSSQPHPCYTVGW